MLKNRFKPIYVDLDDGKWYVTNETTDSNLMSLRVEVRDASTTWYVQHWRRTKKVYFQILDFKVINNNGIQFALYGSGNTKQIKLSKKGFRHEK